METKKAIIIGVIAIIFIATIAVFAAVISGKNSSVNSPQTQTSKPAAKNGADNSSVQSTISADPEVGALESDLNSISEEDFSDSALSDQAVGL